MRNRLVLVSSFLAIVLTASAVAGQSPKAPPTGSPPPSASPSASPSAFAEGSPLEVFAPLLGDWEITSTWEGGEALWSRNEFRVGLGGRFLDARTYAKDGDGDAYERYRTVFAWDAEAESWRSYGFTFDGTVTVVDGLEVGETEGKTWVVSSWGMGDRVVRQRVELTDADTYRWKVWIAPAGTAPGAEGWTQVMDGLWRRVGAAPAAPRSGGS